MAFQLSATSLTPSRPAPQAPSRRPTHPLSSGSSSSGAADSINSSIYASSTLVASGYSPSFSLTPPSPSAGSSGIGGSPNRGYTTPLGSQIVRSGFASVKEEGFASLFWGRKWLVLREETLTFQKNEVRLHVLTCASLLTYVPEHASDERHLSTRHFQRGTH
jgi:serine/threonine-protein kinase CLA4